MVHDVVCLVVCLVLQVVYILCIRKADVVPFSFIFNNKSGQRSHKNLSNHELEVID